VLVVVGQLDDANAQLREKLHKADAAFEKIGVLETEDDGYLACGTYTLHGGGGGGNLRHICILPNEITPFTEGIQRFHRAFPEAAGDHHATHARCLERGEGLPVEVAALQPVDDHD